MRTIGENDSTAAFPLCSLRMSAVFSQSFAHSKYALISTNRGALSVSFSTSERRGIVSSEPKSGIFWSSENVRSDIFSALPAARSRVSSWNTTTSSSLVRRTSSSIPTPASFARRNAEIVFSGTVS